MKPERRCNTVVPVPQTISGFVLKPEAECCSPSESDFKAKRRPTVRYVNLHPAVEEKPNKTNLQVTFALLEQSNFSGRLCRKQIGNWLHAQTEACSSPHVYVSCISQCQCGFWSRKRPLMLKKTLSVLDRITRSIFCSLVFWPWKRLWLQSPLQWMKLNVKLLKWLLSQLPLLFNTQKLSSY